MENEEHLYMDCQQITDVKIVNLFNQFSYEIDFKNDFGVSILIGPNGTGKTTIMELMSFVFAPSSQGLKKIINIPFESMEFHLDNGFKVILEKKSPSSYDEERIILDDILLTLIMKDERIEISFEDIAYSNKSQILINDRKKLGKSKESDMQFSSAIDRHSSGALIDYDKLTELLAREINILSKGFYADEVSFQFIRANRLESFKTSAHSAMSYYKRRDDYNYSNPLHQINEEFKDMCLTFIREYNIRLRMASEKLPSIFIFDKPMSMPYEQFCARLASYKKRMMDYEEVGLFEADEMVAKYLKDLTYHKKNLMQLNVDENLYAEKEDFLLKYLHVFESTLDFFENEYKKIKLYIDIFNKRNELTKKTMTCTSEGLLIKVNGNSLDLLDLSSGEKNDLIMFYELIFGLGNIIFIDEPEISLHIEWQSDFLNQILNICKLNKMQVIVATHSPYIVYGHDDLLAQKKVITDEHN